eukprot:1495729-Rhodomonas_salina.1
MDSHSGETRSQTHRSTTSCLPTQSLNGVQLRLCPDRRQREGNLRIRPSRLHHPRGSNPRHTSSLQLLLPYSGNRLAKQQPHP